LGESRSKGRREVSPPDLGGKGCSSSRKGKPDYRQIGCGRGGGYGFEAGSKESIPSPFYVRRGRKILGRRDTRREETISKWIASSKTKSPDRAAVAGNVPRLPKDS